MSDITGRSPEKAEEQEQYLIANAPPVSLASLADTLRADLEVTRVDARGPADRPEFLVVRMTPKRAERLREQHGGRLIIEGDAQLVPF